MSDGLPLPVVQAAAAVTPLAAGVSGADPGVATRVEETLRGQVRRQGRKFNKVESLYVPAPVLPPAAWRYECQTCRFWRPGNGEWGTCEVVGLPGDPFGGEAIHALHWCGFWLNRPLEPPLDWLSRWLQPEREERL